MPPASILVGAYGSRTILALQFGFLASNARCAHLQCTSEWSCRRGALSSRVGRNSKLKWGHGRYRRCSSRGASLFGGYYYSPCRARRESSGESKDEEKSAEVADVGRDNSSPGLKARSLVGTYAVSTALAVQESLPPEGVIVLLACLVGVLTGGSVVLFNLAASAVSVCLTHLLVHLHVQLVWDFGFRFFTHMRDSMSFTLNHQ